MYPEWYIIDIILMGYVTIQLLKEKLKFDSIVYLSLLFVMVVLATNIYMFGYNNNVQSNILMLFIPCTLICYFIYLRKTYTLEVLELIARKLTLFFNCYFVINSIIIYLQYRTETFMMEKFLAYNPHPIDHMSGLLGMNGVSILNFIWIATLLFNLYFFLETKSLWRLILLIVEFVVMLELSILNDNKMFSIIFITFILSYFAFYLVNYNINSKYLLKLISIIFLAYLS